MLRHNEAMFKNVVVWPGHRMTGFYFDSDVAMTEPSAATAPRGTPLTAKRLHVRRAAGSTAKMMILLATLPLLSHQRSSASVARDDSRGAPTGHRAKVMGICPQLPLLFHDRLFAAFTRDRNSIWAGHISNYTTRFHSRAGQRGQLMDDVTRACAVAWQAGMQISRV